MGRAARPSASRRPLNVSLSPTSRPRVGCATTVRGVCRSGAGHDHLLAFHAAEPSCWRADGRRADMEFRDHVISAGQLISSWRKKNPPRVKAGASERFHTGLSATRNPWATGGFVTIYGT